VDRVLLLEKFSQLLSGPSNFEIKNGRKWIISLNKYYNSRKFIGVDIQDENGIILHSFDSIVDCAKFLNVDRTTVSKRMKKDIPFILENKRVYIIQKGS
jgi:hypothetical protein